MSHKVDFLNICRSAPTKRIKMGGNHFVSFLEALKRKSTMKMLSSMIVFIFVCVPAAGQAGIGFYLSSVGLSEVAAAAIRTNLQNVLDAIPTNLRYESKELNMMADLTNVKIRGVHVPRPDVTPIPGEGLKVEVTGLSFLMEGLWASQEMDSSRQVDEGTFSVVAAGVNISLFTQLTIKRGKPALTVSRCTASLEEFALDFGDEMNNFMYRQYLRTQIKTDLQNAICEEVHAMRKFLGRKFDRLEPQTLVRSHVLDLSLVNIIKVTENGIHMAIKGQFLGDDIDMKDIPMEIPNGGMLGLTLTEELFNSRLRAEWNAGWNSYSFTLEGFSDEIAKSLPLEWLKESKPLMIKVHIPAPATASISPEGLSVNYLGSAEISLVENANISVNVTFRSTATSHLAIYDSRFLQFELKRLELVLSIPRINLTNTNKVIARLLRRFGTPKYRSTWEVLLFNKLYLSNALLSPKNKLLCFTSDFNMTSL